MVQMAYRPPLVNHIRACGARYTDSVLHLSG